MTILDAVYEAEERGREMRLPAIPAELCEYDRRGIVNRFRIDLAPDKKQFAGWERGSRVLIERFEQLAASRMRLKPGPLQRRLAEIGELFGVHRLELELLGLLVRAAASDAIRELLTAWSPSRHSAPGSVRNLAAALNVAPEGLLNRLNDSRLFDCGLIERCRDGELTINGRLHSLILDGWRSRRQLLLGLVGKPAIPSLEWDHFGHIAMHRDHLERLVGAAIESGTSGINILVYGPPGTGKTEFAKTLAQRLGVPLFAVGEQQPEAYRFHDDISRADRLSALRMAQSMLSSESRGMLLLDEACDVLDEFMDEDRGFGPFSRPRRKRDSSASKVVLNRTLERTPVPTIWIMNHIGGLSEAIVRRFTYVFELPVPDIQSRADVWNRLLRKSGFRCDASEGLALAKRYDVSPGVAATAVQAASLAGRQMEVVHHTVKSLQRALKGHEPLPVLESVAQAVHDPGLLCSSPDIRELGDRLAKTGRRRCSILLHGKPGTGKSAFARELARRLGMEIKVVRCSDLQCLWVGESEKNIARAFAAARDKGQLLVMDEADALLQSRERANQSWEVTQVAEMLTWLETHPLPLCFTVNSTDRMDSASLRRFDYKVEVKPLTPVLCPRAFRLFFGFEAVGPAAEKLGRLEELTPGDFAVVARRARIEGLLPECAGAGAGPGGGSGTACGAVGSEGSGAAVGDSVMDAEQLTGRLVEMLGHELREKGSGREMIGFGRGANALVS